MGFYENKILPKVINRLCSEKPIMKQREKVVPEAYGRVLEVGMGSAINMPLYNQDKVEMVFGLEPSEGMRNLARERTDQSPIDVEFLDLPGEEIPLDDNSIDSIVLTYTLCTIPDGMKALEQMKRVLKPGGVMVFSEHGAAPDEAVAKWQGRINPIWKRLAGGCNLNREIPSMIKSAGFEIDHLEGLYIPNTPRFAGYTYWGQAKI